MKVLQKILKIFLSITFIAGLIGSKDLISKEKRQYSESAGSLNKVGNVVTIDTVMRAKGCGEGPD